MPQKDYYAILGVPRSASDDDIKKAYRALAIKFHPDKNPGKEQWANEKFKEINEAYGVLGNPDKRRQYDQFGTTGDAADVFGSHTTQSTFEDLVHEFGGQGLNTDFLDSIFGDFLRGRSFTFRQYGRPGGSSRIIFNVPEDESLFEQASPVRPPGQDVNYEITITAQQAKKGLEKDLVRGGRRLRVKIPAGIKSGQRVRLGNARFTTDGVPGDIYIKVIVKQRVAGKKAAQ